MDDREPPSLPGTAPEEENDPQNIIDNSERPDKNTLYYFFTRASDLIDASTSSSAEAGDRSNNDHDQPLSDRRHPNLLRSGRFILSSSPITT